MDGDEELDGWGWDGEMEIGVVWNGRVIGRDKIGMGMGLGYWMLIRASEVNEGIHGTLK